MATYVFGYGSLINMNENGNELSHSDTRKVCPVTISGLKRSFNVVRNDGTYRVLGVKDVKTALCNGILIKVSLKELEHLEHRERLYIPKLLAHDRIIFNYNKTLKLKEEDRVICFYPRPKYILAKKIPLRENYLNICAEGAMKISRTFFDDFMATTYGFSYDWYSYDWLNNKIDL